MKRGFGKPRGKAKKESTPPGRVSARQNSSKAVIPITKLKDGAWYQGTGRTDSFGRWDAQARCFWLIGMTAWQNPKTYPEGGKRVVRLKQEPHTEEGGSFIPLRLMKK